MTNTHIKCSHKATQMELKEKLVFPFCIFFDSFWLHCSQLLVFVCYGSLNLQHHLRRYKEKRYFWGRLFMSDYFEYFQNFVEVEKSIGQLLKFRPAKFENNEKPSTMDELYLWMIILYLRIMNYLEMLYLRITSSFNNIWF